MAWSMGLLGASTPAISVAGGYHLLQSETLVSDAPSVQFSSVNTYATQYDHLQIRWSIRTSRVAYADSVRLRFNGDTGNNYNTHILFGNGSAAYGDFFSSTTLDYMDFQRVSSSQADAGLFGGGVIDILDAFNTNKHKTIRNLGGVAGITSQNGQIHITSGSWFNTAALSTMLLYPGSGTNFVAGSRFSLYGLRKS